MNSFKLIATDLDWTLIYDRNKINNENLEYIKKYLALGNPFVIVTGRPLFMCLPLIHELGLDSYPSLSLMTYNGVVFYSFKDKTPKEIAPRITPMEVKELHEYTTSKKLNLLLYFNENVYINEIFDFKDKENSLDHLPLNYDTKIIDNLSTPLYKAIIASDHEYTEQFVVELKDKFNNLDFYFSQRYYLEVMHKGINKGTAIDFLAKYYNISLDEIITLGDSENDVFMFKKVKKSFAMKNAHDSVKKEASDVCLDVKEANFKHIIKKYFDVD